jgi:hypothetical protein
MSEVIQQDGSFRFFIPAELTKSSDGKKYVSGIASTFDEDLQGERIKQEGLELSYFLKRGFFNDDHSKETGAKVGIPTDAKITSKGLWVKGYLLETKRAQEIYELAQAISKAGDDRKLGFSVEGKVLGRDPKNPRVITKAWIKDIAITASPINPSTFMDIAKSFASPDCTQVLVEGETEEEAIGKSTKKKDDDVVDALEDATKKPVVEQGQVEKKDAKVTQEALKDPGKPDLEKELDDVPLAKRAFKSVEVFLNDDGDIVIKGFKLPQQSPDIVPFEDGEDENKAHERNAKNAKEALGAAEKGKKVKGVDKSEPEGNLVKGFSKVHEMGGEREFGDKRIPVHVTTYRHKKSGHHIVVTSKDGAHAVAHMHKKDPEKKGECGDTEILGGHIFHDDPDKGRKGADELDAHLRGFGITHKFADKHKMLGKSIITAADDSNSCELCKADIEKDNLFVIQEGHAFCGEDCIEKALVAGYAFGKVDQVGGAALRIESLEGSQKDLTYGGHVLHTDVKHVQIDSSRANGGTTQVTLKDAMEFLTNRGFPEDVADRILVLMVKNNGDLTKLAEQAKAKK